MGFTPAEVNQMSVWEFAAAVAGWNKAHSEDLPEPPTPERYEEIVSRMIH